MAIAEGPVSAGPASLIRDPADVLAGRIRLTLAGQEYVLPVLTIRENEAWQQELELGMAPILAAGDDLEQILAVIQQFSGRLMEFIRSYDKHGILPDQGDWEKDIYPNELLKAVMEVRLAADPTLGYVIADLSRQVVMSQMQAQLSEATSSSRKSTAGRSRRSGRR